MKYILNSLKIKRLRAKRQGSKNLCEKPKSPKSRAAAKYSLAAATNARILCFLMQDLHLGFFTANFSTGAGYPQGL